MADAESRAKVEIAHVLTMDVVEYSTRLITEQSRIMGDLTRIVRSTSRFLTIIDVLRGNAAAALQDAQLEPKGFWQYYALALAQQAQSDHATVDAALQTLIDNAAVSGPFQIAAVYGLRKEPDKMFEWLKRAYTGRDAGLTQLLVTPFILNYRDDPRFAAFCQKLKVQVPAPAPTKP